jgi:NAD(P)H-hydrate epimerase
VSRVPSEEGSAFGLLISSLGKMGVPIKTWDKSCLWQGCRRQGTEVDIIIDGIAGTGIRGSLEGISAEMVETLNSLGCEKSSALKPLVVSVDLPSGLSDEWKPGMPIVRADATLAIEPLKYCLYNPVARPFAGLILPVGSIFPQELVDSQKGADLLVWENCRNLVPPLSPDMHKYDRGTVEIRAGSPTCTGAAVISARGAQAAGAGLVRLIVDPEIYPIAASIVGSRAAGIMVSPLAEPFQGEDASVRRFKPDTLLLGPGWGRGDDRRIQVERALAEETSGTPLILDADGIALSRNLVFHGNTLITPHIGEFAAYTGVPIEEILRQPVPILLKTAAEKNVFILLKSHVLFIAAPDGRWGIVDGMAPNLASGGSGDLLAGFCAALAGRMVKKSCLDLYACAVAAATLFIHAGKSKELVVRFSDPLELADYAADAAGRAWLLQGEKP